MASPQLEILHGVDDDSGALLDVTDQCISKYGQTVSIIPNLYLRWATWGDTYSEASTVRVRDECGATLILGPADFEGTSFARNSEGKFDICTKVTARPWMLTDANGATRPAKIAVYSSIFGQGDWVKPHSDQTICCDFFMFTDVAEYLNEQQPARVRVLRASEAIDLRPIYRNKYYRLFPWKIPELESYDICIYIDGSIDFYAADMLETLLREQHIADHPVSFARHAKFHSIYEEIQNAHDIQTPKYDLAELDAMAQDYKRDGLPDDHAYYTTGLIVHTRCHADYQPLVVPFLERFYKEMVLRSRNSKTNPFCQIMLPYVIHKCGISIHTIELDVYDKKAGWIVWVH